MRDQQHRPPRHPGGSRGDGRDGLRRSPVLLGQPDQDPIGDHQFLRSARTSCSCLASSSASASSSLRQAVIRSSYGDQCGLHRHGLPRAGRGRRLVLAVAPASVPATRGPSCTPPRATPTPSGCTSRWASGCATARRASRRGCRRQRGSSNADVQTSGGRSPPRLGLHSTHGSHMRSEGVPVPGRSCPVPGRRVRDDRRPGERADDLLSRVARPRLAIPGNSRHFPDHSVPAGGPFSARPPLPTSVTARRRSSPQFPASSSFGALAPPARRPPDDRRPVHLREDPCEVERAARRARP